MEHPAAAFTLMEIFRMGGVVMWPLLFFSIATVAITVERAVCFLYHNLKVDDLKEKVAAAIGDGDVADTKAFLESQTRRRMGARVLLALVSRRGLSERRLEKAVEAEAAASISSLEGGFGLLTAMASLAPLTGFLGTVTGMIAAFRSIAEAADVNARIVAGGIYEALITTVFGLIIAIVAISAHSIFTNIVDRFASELEIACSDLINMMCETAKHDH
ncbi:MAG: MotA/TolQ/ExbB proton channel family protein [Treponema sp.]|nr:MotA/TolQ/ExbB proton channel family protein [Treponema sp.]